MSGVMVHAALRLEGTCSKHPRGRRAAGQHESARDSLLSLPSQRLSGQLLMGADGASAPTRRCLRAFRFVLFRARSKPEEEVDEGGNQDEDFSVDGADSRNQTVPAARQVPEPGGETNLLPTSSSKYPQIQGFSVRLAFDEALRVASREKTKLLTSIPPG